MLMRRDEEGRAVPGAGDASVTDMLHAWHDGSEAARNRVFELTYDELRRIAGAYLRREGRQGSLQVTGLVHEAFLRLVDTKAAWADRRHFYGVAAQAMRRVLVDHARRRIAAKRPQGQLAISLDEAPEAEAISAIGLDEALVALERLDPRQARIVELRYFGGFSVEETARVLAVSPATVKRECATARAWIERRLRGPGKTS